MAYDYGEGRMGNPSRQNSKQPGGGMGGYSKGAFGKGPGSKSEAGVTYEGAAAGTCSNGGNYNVTEGKARMFGTGGAMKG